MIKNEGNNETPPTENVVMKVNSNSQSILLQPARAEIFNYDENEPCSQRTYCTNNLRKTRKLKIVRKGTF